MSSRAITPPFPVFSDSDGTPLENGFIYIGVENLDPVTNPISVYWDEALTIPALQPVRTLNGYPSRSGSPAQFFANSNYSILVKNKSGVAVYSSTSSTSTLADDLLSSDSGKGTSLVTYLAPFVGAIARSLHLKLADCISVTDFGADPTGIADSTAAFTAAQAAVASTQLRGGGKRVRIPAGTYLLDSFFHHEGTEFIGDGINCTFIKQGSTSKPAWWVLSGTSTVSPFPVYNTQILGAKLSGVWFLGKAGSTVASMIVEAHSPYVVAYSDFEIAGSGGFHTLEVITGSAFEVYSSRFHVTQDDSQHRSGDIGSTDTGVVCGAGVYNQWYLNIAKAMNGIAVTDSGWNSLFHHIGAEGQICINGSNNVILNPFVEYWSGAARSSALQFLGAGNTIINPNIINVPRSKMTTAGIELNNGGGAKNTIIGMRVQGATLSAASSPAFGFTAPLVAATSATLLNAFTYDTGTYNVTFSDGSIRSCTLTNGATTCTWAGAVTASAVASAKVNTPIYPIAMGVGSSGAFIDCTADDTVYKMDAYVAPETLAICTFVGDCRTLTNLGGNYKATPSTISAAAYTVDASFGSKGFDTSLLNVFAGTVTVTFPTSANFIGREITIGNTVAELVNASGPIIKPMTGAATTAILPATIGKWARLQFDGTNWNVISNN